MMHVFHTPKHEVEQFAVHTIEYKYRKHYGQICVSLTNLYEMPDS